MTHTLYPNGPTLELFDSAESAIAKASMITDGQLYGAIGDIKFSVDVQPGWQLVHVWQTCKKHYTGPAYASGGPVEDVVVSLARMISEASRRSIAVASGPAAKGILR